MNHSFSIIPLTVEARGEVTSNIDEFRELVREALANINRDLQTDEQFGQAELDAKALKSAEDAVKSAKDKALADAEALHALFSAMDATSEEIRVARLDLETQIKRRKEEVKNEIVEEFLAEFDIDPRTARKHFAGGLEAAIKGKRTVESMRAACQIYQQTQQAQIIASRSVLDRFAAKFGPDSIPDRAALELQTPELVEAELVRRIQAKKAAVEAAKLQAELAAAKAAAAQPATQATTPEESSLTEAEEWKAFKSAALAAFAPLKSAKASLQFPKNSAKAQIFANAINAAWQEVMQ